MTEAELSQIDKFELTESNLETEPPQFQSLYKGAIVSQSNRALSRIFLIESFFCSFSGLGKHILGGEVPPLSFRISPFLHGFFGAALSLCSCFSAFCG